MIKEYSDLSDKQKLIYIKRSIIQISFAFVPFVIVFGLFGSVMLSMPQDANYSIVTNSTNAEVNEVKDSKYIDLYMVGFMILFFGAVIGLVDFGSCIGTLIANKLNLYTDFELEAAERKLTRIKEALEKK